MKILICAKHRFGITTPEFMEEEDRGPEGESKEEGENRAEEE